MSDTSNDGFSQLVRRFFARMVLGKDLANFVNEPDSAADVPTASPTGAAALPADPVDRQADRKPQLSRSNADCQPKTLEAETQDASLNRPIVFDPALKHFSRALRGGEPQFTTPEIAAVWDQSRLQVLHHVLKTIEASNHSASLVIRGSILLATWLGDAARKPGDLDCVVLPAHWKVSYQASKRLVDDLIELLQGSQATDTIQIPDRLFASEEIWTYERAPGLRVIVPWEDSQQGFGGTVQLDFVFGEELPSPPSRMCVVVGEQSPVEVLAATAEQSLAWKLLWLSTDAYANGKDLYDAVLLAEHTPIDLQLLKKTFQLSEDPPFDQFKWFNQTQLEQLHVEWEDFQSEYPHVTGSDEAWKQRLVRALDPLWKQIADSLRA